MRKLSCLKVISRKRKLYLFGRYLSYTNPKIPHLFVRQNAIRVIWYIYLMKTKCSSQYLYVFSQLIICNNNNKGRCMSCVDDAYFLWFSQLCFGLAVAAETGSAIFCLYVTIFSYSFKRYSYIYFNQFICLTGRTIIKYVELFCTLYIYVCFHRNIN